MYRIELDNKLIGTTALENADAPQGVVFGKIMFTEITKPYEYFLSYFKKNNVQIVAHYPEDKLISGDFISTVKVFSENNHEILGISTCIEGMKNEFYIYIIGIDSELLKQEFKHHYNAYY